MRTLRWVLLGVVATGLLLGVNMGLLLRGYGPELPSYAEPAPSHLVFTMRRDQTAAERVLRGVTYLHRPRTPGAFEGQDSCHVRLAMRQAVLAAEPERCDDLEEAPCLDQGGGDYPGPSQAALSATCRAYVARETGHPQACDGLPRDLRSNCLFQLMIHHERFSLEACAEAPSPRDCLMVAAAKQGGSPYCDALQSLGASAVGNASRSHARRGPSWAPVRRYSAFGCANRVRETQVVEQRFTLRGLESRLSRSDDRLGVPRLAPLQESSLWPLW